MKIILIFILLFINFIFGCKEFVIDYQEKQSTGCIGTSSLLVINNYQQYKLFTISPEPLDIITTLNEKSFKVEYGKTYTLSYTSLNCTTPKTTTFIPTTPTPLPATFSIIQPKCAFSKGSIVLSNKNSNSEYTIFSDSGSSVTVVGTSFDLVSGNYLIKDSTQSSNCDASFSIDPTPNSNLPEITISPGFCYRDNGSIIVENEGSYNSIKLVNTLSNSEIQSSTTGKFLSLPSADYTLTLISTTCGIQEIPVNVPSANPRLDFTFTESDCPSTPTIKVSIDDSDDEDSKTDIFSMTLGGKASSITSNEISPTIPASTSSLPFTFDYEGCSIKFQLPLPKAIMNLNYDIKDSFENSLLNDCAAKSSITLSYDKNQITDLKVNDADSGSSVSANQDGSYPIEMGNKLSITSSCYPDPTFIEIPQPEPLYQVENGIKTSCFGNTSIQIFNYLDFSDIYLEYASDTSKTIKLDSDGYFKNIYRTSYNLVYKLCSNSKVSKKLITLYDESVTPEFTIVSNPSNLNIDCQSLTGSLSITFKNPDNTQSSPYKVSYNPVLLNIVPLVVNDYCTINLNLNSKLSNTFNYVLNKKPKITINNNASCLYSNDASVKITHDDLLFDTIIIGDKQFINNKVDNVYGGLSSGQYSVKVIISNQDDHFCGGLVSDLGTITIPSKDSTFKVITTINSVSDCSTASGSIQVSNYESFSSLKIDSTSATDGLFSNLASNIYSIDFTSATCSGSLPVYVPTNNDNVLLTNIIQQPTCYAADTASIIGDGIVSFTLLDSTGQNLLNIDKVIELNSNTQSSISSISNSPGNKDFLILSGKCSFRKSVTLTLSDPKLAYSSSFPFTCIGNYESGVISSKNSDVTIDSIKLLSSDGSSDTLNGYTIANINKGQYGAIVNWNSVCKKTIGIVANSPKDIVKPVLTFIQDSCMSDYNLQLKVENYQIYGLLSINGQVASNDGVFYKLPVGSGTLIYMDNESKCYSSIDFNYDYKIATTSNKAVSDSIKGVQLETCHGTCNGYLNYSTSSLPTTNYYSSIIIKENYNSYLLPTKSLSTSDIQSYGISTNTLLFNSISKTNPICSLITPVQYLSYEPELRSLSDQCSPYYSEETSEETSEEGEESSLSSSSSSSSNITIKIPTVNYEEFLLYVSDKDSIESDLPNSLKVNYSLVNIKTQEKIETQSLNSAQYHGLEYGEYKLTAQIDSKICKRKVVHTFIVDSTTANNPYLVMVDSENYCEKVHFTPSNINATYSYYIRNSTNHLVYNYTLMVGSFSSDLLILGENYTVQADQYENDNVTIYKSCQIAFNISRKCPKEKDTNIKLILALVLGVGIAGVIIVYTIYKIRERSMKKFEEKQHELDDHQEDDNQSVQQHHFIGE